MPIQSARRRALISAFLDHNAMKSIISSLISGSVHWPFKLPQSFFKLYKLFHQLREYFVFCLKFLLQGQYFIFFRPILIFYSIKCPWSMLKKTVSASDKTPSVGACIGHKYQISELSPADASLWCLLFHQLYSRLVPYPFSSPVWVIK